MGVTGHASIGGFINLGENNAVSLLNVEFGGTSSANQVDVVANQDESTLRLCYWVVLLLDGIKNIGFRIFL